MKYYLLPIVFVIIASLAVTFVPYLTKQAQQSLIAIQVPTTSIPKEAKAAVPIQKVISFH